MGMNQPKLFEQSTETIAIGDVLLYALGDFQSRGKVLADRELALDRLHGAFLRASLTFGTPEFSDEAIAAGLRELGVAVNEIPSYVAKRPYRIIVPEQLCKTAFDLFVDERTKHKD